MNKYKKSEFPGVLLLRCFMPHWETPVGSFYTQPWTLSNLWAEEDSWTIAVSSVSGPVSDGQAQSRPGLFQPVTIPKKGSDNQPLSLGSLGFRDTFKDILIQLVSLSSSSEELMRNSSFKRLRWETLKEKKKKKKRERSPSCGISEKCTWLKRCRLNWVCFIFGLFLSESGKLKSSEIDIIIFNVFYIYIKLSCVTFNLILFF